MWVKVFGFALAGGIIATSIAMAYLGGGWQQIEASAYAGEKRPAWFWAASVLVLALYGVALWSFIASAKTWAGWLLMVILPLGWGLKAGMVILNKQGRQAVSAISGDQSWTKIALARLPAAVVLALLAWFA